MFQNDFIMRMIEQLTLAIARVLGFKQAGELSRAAMEVDDTCRTLIGLDPDTVLRLPLAALLDMLRSQGRLDSDRAAALARLLYEKGLILAAAGDAGAAHACDVRAFCLFDEVATAGDASALELHREALEELENRLENGT